MPVTTLQLDEALHARLRREAEVRGTTTTKALEELLAEGGRARRFQSLEAALRATSAEDWQSWEDETRAWHPRPGDLDRR